MPPPPCSYIDHFMYKGHLCIVTDYCEAGDLWQLLMGRKTPLLEGQVCVCVCVEGVLRCVCGGG